MEDRNTQSEVSSTVESDSLQDPSKSTGESSLDTTSNLNAGSSSLNPDGEGHDNDLTVTNNSAPVPSADKTSLMFGSTSSTEILVKSAHFEFGSKSIMPEESCGFDSTDSTTDVDFFNAQEAVQSAIELIDKGVIEDEGDKVGCEKDKNKDDSCREKGDNDKSCSSKKIVDICPRDESANSQFTNNKDNISTNSENETDISVLVNEGEVDNSIVNRENNINCDESDNDNTISDNNVRQQECEGDKRGSAFEGKNVSSKVLQNVEGGADQIGLGKTDENECFKKVLEEMDESEESKLDEQHLENCNMKIEETKTVEDESVHLDIDKNNENEKSEVEENKIRADLNVKEDILNAENTSCFEMDDVDTSSKGYDELDDPDESVKCSTDLGSVETYNDAVSETEISEKDDDVMDFEADDPSSVDSNVAFVSDNIDGGTLSVTLENFEVSVFEKGTTDELSSSFLKSLQRETEVLSEAKNKEVEFKVSDETLNPDENHETNNTSDLQEKPGQNISVNEAEEMETELQVMKVDEGNNTEDSNRPSESQTELKNTNVELLNTCSTSAKSVGVDSNKDNSSDKVSSDHNEPKSNSDEVLADKSDLLNLIKSAVEKNEDFRKNLDKSLVNQENSSDPKASKETEVICLVDDDDDEVVRKKKPAAAVKCVNPNCMSGEGLYRPAMFVLTYFGMKRARDQNVCQECFNMVFEHQEKLAVMLKEGKPLYSADFPNHKDVILLDSDEESFSDDEGDLSDDTMSMIRDNLDDVIAESLIKYGLDHQIRESCDFLNNKLDTLEDESKELTKRFDKVQSTLDEARKLIYEDYTHPIQEIEELHFTDCEIPPMPIFKSKLQNQLYNRELQAKLRKSQLDREASSHQYSASGSTRTIATKKVTQISQSQASYDYTAQDVIALHTEARCDPPPDLPPVGPLSRPKLRVGDLAYTMKVSYFSIWVLARVIEVIPRNTTEVEDGQFQGDCYVVELLDVEENDPATETYRVRLENVKKNSVRTVTGKYLAYPKPARVQPRVGTRVIAVFKEEDDNVSYKNYYVGVIAEPPKSTNKYRYLVFFDDGYTQYCPHDNILVVCSSSKNVWEDIHPEPRDFIKNYLQQYPERPMVKMSRGQVVKVEWNGRWWIVRVLEVDASLVKVHFDADRRTEWIYRGSTRLGPMYQELAAAKERQSGSLLRSRGFGSASAHKSDMPYVEYTRGDGDDKKDEEKEVAEEQPAIPPRSVARKSTAKKPPELVISNTTYAKPLVNHVPQGTVTQRTIESSCKPLRFRPHQCNRSCVAWTDYSPEVAKKYDPLIKPLMFGFTRLNMNYRGKTMIQYKGPCGRTLRSQQEMLIYLQATKSALTIDLFDFEYWVNVLSVFQESKTFGRIEDLSYGKENVPISCVNELDHSMPQYVQYMTARQPAKDVNLNLDPEFMVGCECEDDCEDRSKCSCWKLTMQGKAYIPDGGELDGEVDPLFGYQYRRLPERIATGIYECSSKCKCSATCQNRVAQQPLACRLQLFKTPKKGWGIRCLHDIPRGTFICIYAGFLLTEQEANEGGKAYGDEYLAELDYIESVENLKEGYESEAKEPSDFEDDDGQTPDMMDVEYDEDRQSPDSDVDGNYKPHHEDIRWSSQSSPITSPSPSGWSLRLRRRTVEDSDKESARPKQDEDTISISDDEADNDAYYYTVTSFSDTGICGGCRQPLDIIKDTIKCQACVKSFHPKCTALQTLDTFQKLGSKKSSWICTKCELLVRKPQTFDANITESEDREVKYPSVRKLYGSKEDVYIMDAKTHGNIGRYLNHSCSPNVFVQNVFVDTHDLRFPWVAFFANQYIAAGTELTWDYNYDVGSVPGKVMLCYCGNNNCRGRLL